MQEHLKIPDLVPKKSVPSPDLVHKESIDNLNLVHEDDYLCSCSNSSNSDNSIDDYSCVSSDSSSSSYSSFLFDEIDFSTEEFITTSSTTSNHKINTTNNFTTCSSATSKHHTNSSIENSSVEEINASSALKPNALEHVVEGFTNFDLPIKTLKIDVGSKLDLGREVIVTFYYIDLDEGISHSINSEILEDLSRLPKGSTHKSSRNLRTSMNHFPRETLAGDLYDFGRLQCIGIISLLSYPPNILPQKLSFPKALHYARHQDEFEVGEVRCVGKVGGEFIMSTTVSNEQDGKTLKEFRFPKKPLMMIVGEAKFMCKQNALIEIFHAAGRGVNFSNSFAYDLKMKQMLIYFAGDF